MMFGLAHKSKDLVSLVVAIIVYALLPTVIGFVFNFLKSIIIIGIIKWILGIIMGIITIYCVIGIVMAILVFLRIIK